VSFLQRKKQLARHSWAYEKDPATAFAQADLWTAYA